MQRKEPHYINHNLIIAKKNKIKKSILIGRKTLRPTEKVCVSFEDCQLP